MTDTKAKLVAQVAATQASQATAQAVQATKVAKDAIAIAVAAPVVSPVKAKLVAEAAQAAKVAQVAQAKAQTAVDQAKAVITGSAVKAPVIVKAPAAVVPLPKPAPPPTKPLAPPVAVVPPKAVPVATAGLAGSRAERREVFKEQPLEVRAVTVAMLPDTPKSMGAKVDAQKQVLEAAMKAPVMDAGAQAAKASVVTAEAQKLASLVTASQALRESKESAGVKTLSKPVAQATLQGVKSEAAKVQRELAETKDAARKAPSDAVKAGLDTKVQLLAAKVEENKVREVLLAKGQDIDKPRRVEPGNVTAQRKPLQLPTAFVPPSKGEIVTAARVITTAVKPDPGESIKAHEIRVRGVLERTLVRNARNQALGKPAGEAMSEAISEAIRVDKPVIDAEVKETGGLAKDPASQVVEVLIDQVAKEVAQAAVTAAPPVPSTPPTESQVLATIYAAEAEIVKTAAAPKEVMDEIREDIILADQPIAEDVWYKRPSTLLGVALLAAGGGYYAWRRWGTP